MNSRQRWRNWKKVRSSLLVGICVGALVSFIMFIKDLLFFEILAYFFFWVWMSPVVFHISIGIKGWFKGLLLSLLFALPVFVLTIGSLENESLVYSIANLTLITALMGIVIGYFNGIAEEEYKEKTKFVKGYLKKIAIASLSGIAAGLIIQIPITLTGWPPIVGLMAMYHWLLISIVISLTISGLKHWLEGALIGFFTVLPVALLFINYMPGNIAAMLLLNIALGIVVGSFNGKYAKAVAVV